MPTLLADLRFAVRMLVKSPGFTAAAVLTLGLGVGANTAVFSVIDGVLLRPLPYRNPAELVVIWETNAQAAIFREPTSAPNFLDWRAQNRALDGMAASANWIPTLSGQGDPQQLTGSMVTAEFFPVLGVAPALGALAKPERGSGGGSLTLEVVPSRVAGRVVEGDSPVHSPSTGPVGPTVNTGA